MMAKTVAPDGRDSAGRFGRSTLEERLQRNSSPDPETGCLVWRGTRNASGYGQIIVYEEGKRVTRIAHRVAWEHVHGPIAPGLVVRHLVCDRPLCINVAHLALGTQGDNIDDKVAKGRQAWGARHGSAKLSLKTIEACRARRAAGATFSALSREFSVDRGAIRRALSGEAWRPPE